LPVVGKEWEYSVKKAYYPLIENKDLPERSAAKLSGKFYNVKPIVFSKNTDKGVKQYIAYKTIRLGYPNIAIMPLSGENGGMKRLIKGERSAKFESLHFLDSGIDVDNSGRLIFASKNQETDVLNIYDINTSKLIESHKFAGVTAINSPAWSPDGLKIAFSGATINGQYDIYIYNLADRSLTRMTNDIYFDQTPSFSPDGGYLVFSSDRDCANGKNIYALDLKSLAMKQLTFGDFSNVSPKWAHGRDSLIFSSDRDGVPNIYLLEHPLSGESRLARVTNFITGAFDPVFTLDDSSIVFCAYQDMNYHIYKSAPDTSVEIIETPKEVKTWTITNSWQPSKITGDSCPEK
jgi:Tol biopolymer transport system component